MPNEREKRQEMLHFLDHEFFDQVLGASTSDYAEQELKRLLRDVQASTQTEKDRFHVNYRSPEEIKDNYLADVNSIAAKEVDSELEALGLPTLPKLKTRFLDLCNRLKV